MMKRILAYICIALAVVSCSKIDNFEQELTPGNSGKVRLSVATPQSVTGDTYNPMDNCAIRVYKYSDATNGDAARVKELIRHYKSLGDVPAQLALLAGDYAVRVDVGSKAAASFTEVSYRGETDFTIEPSIITSVNVECNILNSVVKVVFDESISQKLDLEAWADVCISETYDAAAINAGKVPYLRFDDSATGYFLMPEDTKSLNWFFHGKGSAEGIGTVEKSGVINNVAAATMYTLTFKYSKSLGGSVSFDIEVDDSVEIFNDKIVFSPDPTVKGVGFDPADDQYVLSDSYTFNIAALANINLMSITVEGNSYDMLNGSNSGISVAKKDDKHYSVTLAPEFFAPLNGGSHEVLFKVSDQDGGEANIPVLFWTQGISPIGNNFDLWYNTANFSGVAFDPAASSVAVKYRTAGGAWKQLSASTTSTANIYSATANDFAAGISYEYALFVNDSQVGNILSVVTPEGAQIPESDLENWTEKDGQIMCPTSTLLNTTWDTGNHATASIGAGNLTNPSNDVRPGSKGNKSAYMKSMKAAVMGIGKFAAGNLFVGKFVQISGMGGIVDFGKPFEFTARPKAVKFWMKSNCGVIDLEDKLKLEGEIDLTKIFICFSDRSEPYRVNTNDETTLFDPRTAPNVVALSYYESKTSVTEWTEITLPIEYKDNDTKPNFLVFTFTCSGYGDYFTGSTDSFMYVDDIELVY